MSELPINRYLDHAVLKPELSRTEAVDAIQLGIDYKVRTVCVRPCDIELAAEMCEGSDSDVSCVLSFPHGCNPSELKAREAELYISKGTKEIDMVANYGWIQSGLFDLVEKDIRSVVDVVKAKGVLLKVILETGMLELSQVAEATEAAIRAGADFVKTSTGFNGGGATEEAVKTMIDTARGRIKVKASGGIRSTEQARAFIALGCERLGNGFSSTAAICGGEAANEEPSAY